MEIDSSPHHTQPETIQRMFGAIAKRYDTANSVLSLGIHHLWRNALIAQSRVMPGQRVFDAATGTGDLALAFAPLVGPTGAVIGGDFSEPMLELARQKQAARLPQSRYPWLHFQFADVMKLPFESESFDIVSISFGIRNVADAESGLRELARVLKPGGTLLVLEFGGETPGLWGRFFKWYSNNILPIIGGTLTGEKKAYRYLQESSAKFPSRDAFIALLHRAAPWQSASYRALTGGVAYLYHAVK